MLITESNDNKCNFTLNTSYSMRFRIDLQQPCALATVIFFFAEQHAQLNKYCGDPRFLERLQVSHTY